MGGSKNLLFLKKKKQKDFYDFAPGLAAMQSHKSFLVLFFKKEHSFYTNPRTRSSAAVSGGRPRNST